MRCPNCSAIIGKNIQRCPYCNIEIKELLHTTSGKISLYLGIITIFCYFIILFSYFFIPRPISNVGSSFFNFLLFLIIILCYGLSFMFSIIVLISGCVSYYQNPKDQYGIIGIIIGSTFLALILFSSFFISF